MTIPVVGPDRSRLFDLTSVLLTYPDSRLFAAGDELRAAVGEITHPEVHEQLMVFLDRFTATDPLEIETHYVRTFDLHRRSGLYLTYYLHGDTRKRGIALLTLKQRYRAHGLRLTEGELPDLLPVVLEFAALAGHGDGEAPLRQHRRGLELLRAALEETGSPYQHLLEAVIAALPPLTDTDRDAIRALAQDGPPVESVGLARTAPISTRSASAPTSAPNRAPTFRWGVPREYVRLDRRPLRLPRGVPDRPRVAVAPRPVRLNHPHQPTPGKPHPATRLPAVPPRRARRHRRPRHGTARPRLGHGENRHLRAPLPRHRSVGWHHHRPHARRRPRLLIARRIVNGRVRRTTTTMDKALYAALALMVALGMTATVGTNLLGDGYDYRDTIAVWFRGIF